MATYFSGCGKQTIGLAICLFHGYSIVGCESTAPIMWDRKAIDIGCKCHYIQHWLGSEENNDKHKEPCF